MKLSGERPIGERVRMEKDRHHAAKRMRTEEFVQAESLGVSMRGAYRNRSERHEAATQPRKRSRNSLIVDGIRTAVLALPAESGVDGQALACAHQLVVRGATLEAGVKAARGAKLKLARQVAAEDERLAAALAEFHVRAVEPST